MTIQADEAASALKDAEAAAGRAAMAHGYRAGSAYLILWGVVWTVANLAAQASPHLGGIVWPLGSTLGAVGSVVLGVRQGGPRNRAKGLKALLIASAIALFGIGAAMISPPLTFGQGEAMACLGVGAIYIAMGAGVGLRLSAVGAAIIVATLAGWFLAREYFFLWMAVTGGGGLILGGLWFRKV